MSRLDTSAAKVTTDSRASLLEARGITDLPEPADEELLASGLSAEQVAAREELELTNEQNTGTTRPLWRIISTHVFTLFNLVIGLCALGIIVLQRWLDLLFSIAALTNIIIGVAQEYMAKVKLDRIALLHQSDILVFRDGERVHIPMAEAVLDDVVILRAGDQVPADGIVLRADDLDLDESVLTGEADAVHKTAGDDVLSGTSVLGGTGWFRITGVGADSHAAQLTAEAKKFSKIHSELRDALDRVAKWITIVLIPLIVVTLHGQVMAQGGWSRTLSEGTIDTALVASIAGITTMIPQGLALMTTISFAMAALQLAQKKVLIQEQPAVEILARVDTVCLDKTGTLTEGGMIFNEARVLTEVYDDTDDADPEENPLGWHRVLAYIGADPNANSTAQALDEPFPVSPDEDPTDHVPFASARRWSAFAFGTPGDTDVDPYSPTGAWVLGAPEALIDHLEISAEQAEELNEQTTKLAGQGLRTMMLAHSLSPISNGASDTSDAPWFAGTQQLPEDLSPVVMMTFKENVRDDASEVLGYFRDQGVDLKVISGDSPHTVAAVAREVGWDHEGPGFDGRDLPEDPEELADVMANHSIFGRIGPDQKKAMVEAMQSRDHVVAMTGDGINDALALKTADLGIAMGNAAPATKAVSRMVLLDSKFSRLPDVLAQGRKVIANMEQLAHLFLTKTAYAFGFILIFSLIFWQYPLLPRQTSTADALFIGMASFVLALLPNTRRYVPGFLKRALTFAIPSALVLVAALLFINYFARAWAGDFSGVLPASAGPEGLSMPQLQTGTYITLTLTGLWLLNVVARPLNWQKIGVLALMYVGFVLTLIVPISLWYHQFEIPPTPIIWAAVATSVVGAILLEIVYRIHHAKMSPEEYAHAH